MKICCLKWLNQTCRFGLTCLMAAVTSNAFAGQGDSSAGCSVRDRSEALVILVCAPDLEKEAWRKAAEEVCGATLMCNAWIWDDPAKAPTKAPTMDSEIPRDKASSAAAIWVNDSKSLISLRRVK